MRDRLYQQYITVRDHSKLSFGGSQLWSENKTTQSVGCGVVAGLDLLIYLISHHPEIDCDLLRSRIPQSSPIPIEDYNALLHTMRKHYFPLIPGHGINGLLLAAGVERFFLKYHMPYIAVWGVPYSRLWSEIERMLKDDIPVIFSIGPNFPLFWQHHGLRFYYQTAGGSFLPGPQTHAHYVTVTGMDDQWLQISSWGKQYYIRRDEYLQYVKEHSLRLVSNILLIRRKS